MSVISRRYCTKIRRDVFPSSSFKVFRKNKTVSKIDSLSKSPETKKNAHSDTVNANEFYANAVKIQMISQNLYKQLFGNASRAENTVNASQFVAELRRHGINIESTEPIPDVLLNLPKLHGSNIEEHFYAIAKDQVKPYEDLLLPLVYCKKLPPKPAHWVYSAGWTMYDPETGEGRTVEFPMEDAFVLDVEVCVKEGGAPVLATAVSATHWYSWAGLQLIKDVSDKKAPSEISNNRHGYTLEQLIPLGVHGPKVVVGHNVSYDRARLREQYLLEDTKVRFIDTMSLHVCVSGITSYQRALHKSKKDPALEDREWLAQSSLNSLVDVHRLYCGGKTLTKESRDVFVEGSLDDVRANFQSLVSYCAKDVEATQNILQVLYPMYAERFPHPATLAGMLEMGSAYLPTNTNWLRFLRESDLAYEDLDIEAKYHLSRRADEACALLNDAKYQNHIWLWDEDWSVQVLKMKRSKVKSKSKNTAPCSYQNSNLEHLPANEERLHKKFKYLYDMQTLLPVRRPLLPGYPAWYRKLCRKPPADVTHTHWEPGPTEIGTGMQIAPKLLSLCWEGYPLHYLREYGWGFLVPFRSEHPQVPSEEFTHKIPIKDLTALCPIPEFAHQVASASESEYAFESLDKELGTHLGRKQFYAKARQDKTAGLYRGSGIWCNKILDDCCFYFKLPHKNGTSFRVGNPLSRDFLNKFTENVLSSGDRENQSAARIIEIARMMSYWRNNRDRIRGQIVVWLPNHSSSDLEYGAICPQVVACGTLTRRAMEPTWMTASNSQLERIGSELRAMVQAPKSYRIVGADVDSQELWIASVLGDAYASGPHGSTPLGWMTLSGSKGNRTDMHSVTAKAVGISRDHAKVINYARIYGAGQNFAERLLRQFNPSFSESEAKSKAAKMFSITKGKRVLSIREEFRDEYQNKRYTLYEAKRIAVSTNRSLDEMFYKPKWEGGTESAMFNRLEEIAMGENPVTPFLGCRLSRALEANYTDENRFLPTRVNWVVQSGAVDFLHLMLVTMRWLMGPHVRFCLSFHDEIRYLVKDEMAYKAALAMHVTNLLVRAFCASRIGLKDLPMSVAFFSSVEVDNVLRKESTMDCKTPSNPHGLKIGYGIPVGESLTIHEAINKAGGSDMRQWHWVK